MVTNQQILDIIRDLLVAADIQTEGKPTFSLVVSKRNLAKMRNSIELCYRKMQRKAVMRHRQRR